MPPRVRLLLPLVFLPACFTDTPVIGPVDDDDTDVGASSDGGDVPPDPSAGATSTSGPGESSDAADESSGAVPPDAGDGSSTGEPVDPPDERLVFVTAGEFFANLGGVAGADARCMAEAEAAGHGGQFLAWISDAATSPADRFELDGGPWIRVDDALVAEDWGDLVDGTIANPIELDAEGLPLDDQLAVWTNTSWDGTALGADCQGWQSMAFEDSGIFGDFLASDDFGQWTAWGNPTPFPCENTFHLYCFEQ